MQILKFDTPNAMCIELLCYSPQIDDEKIVGKKRYYKYWNHAISHSFVEFGICTFIHFYIFISLKHRTTKSLISNFQSHLSF